MDLRIDEQRVQEAMDANVSETIKNVVNGYRVRSAVEKAVSDSLLGEVLAVAVQNAVSAIDVQVLTRSLAEQMARSVTKATAHLVRTAMIEMILDLKKIPYYEQEKRQKEREKLEVAL